MRGRCLCVDVALPRDWKLAIGESVSVDGICSTIVAMNSRLFSVEYMPETLKKTTAAAFASKRVVNLERSLKWNERVHGHVVAGHVDAKGRVVSFDNVGRSKRLVVRVPLGLSRFIAARGSIAINGVSLTIVAAQKGRVEVALIPHTLAATNLANLKRGDEVNVECDLLARYALNARVKPHAAKRVRTQR